MPSAEFHSAGCGAFLLPFTLKDSPDGAERDDTSQLPKMSRRCFSGEWGLLTFLRGNMVHCAPGVMGLACHCHGLGCVPERGTSQKPSWCHQPTVEGISPSAQFLSSESLLSLGPWLPSVLSQEVVKEGRVEGLALEPCCLSLNPGFALNKLCDQEASSASLCLGPRLVVRTGWGLAHNDHSINVSCFC